jgi:hypothetical protein
MVYSILFEQISRWFSPLVDAEVSHLRGGVSNYTMGIMNALIHHERVIDREIFLAVSVLSA